MESEADYTWLNKETFVDKHDIVKYFCGPNSVSSIILKYLWNKTSKQNSVVDRVDVLSLLQHPTMSNKEQASALGTWQSYKNSQVYERYAHAPEILAMLDATKVIQGWVKSKAYCEGVGFDGTGLVMYNMISLLVDLLERASTIAEYTYSNRQPGYVTTDVATSLEQLQISSPTTISSSFSKSENQMSAEQTSNVPNTRPCTTQDVSAPELSNRPKLLEYPDTPYRIEGSLQDIADKKGRDYLKNKKFMILDGKHAREYASYKGWHGTTVRVCIHSTPPKELVVTRARRVGILKE